MRHRTKRIVKWVAGCLILTAVVWGLITYGPEILERKSTLDGVPLYPGAELHEPRDVIPSWDTYWALLPASWSGHCYKSSAPLDTIAEWYKSQLAEWKMEIDEDIGWKISLAFSKEGDGVVIRIFKGIGDAPRIMLMTGPKDGIPHALRMMEMVI